MKEKLDEIIKNIKDEPEDNRVKAVRIFEEIEKKKVEILLLKEDIKKLILVTWLFKLERRNLYIGKDNNEKNEEKHKQSDFSAKGFMLGLTILVIFLGVGFQVLSWYLDNKANKFI
ncbi:hypothetical protein SteCoe_33163 [Stentor coeruleus]|uniref:Uncharacterized protein n=1 Tax=Stentor coeruleus TaxID=5963 RepID=A0A1R2AXD7_9CILI|nr:hypothetical protein SteCoe_33163 [Stentor coeruleus]